MANQGITVILGAYARIEPDSARQIRLSLGRLDGVGWFDLDDAGKVGLLIEAADLDHAYRTLTEEIGRMPGVLGLWPVYVDTDQAGSDPLEESSSPPSPATEETVSTDYQQ